MDIYELGEKNIGDKKKIVFASEKAIIYTKQADYEKATEQYVLLLDKQTGKYNWVRNQIRSIPERDLMITLLEKESDDNHKNMNLHRLLGELYLERGWFDKALNEYRELESMNPKANGKHLLDLGRLAEEKKLYDIALQSYQELIESYPDSPLLPEVLFAIGGVYRILGDYYKAINNFRRVFNDYPKSNYYIDAGYLIGQIYLWDLAKPIKARSSFEQLLKVQPYSVYRFDALFAIGDTYLIEGKLDDAEKQYKKTHTNNGNITKVKEQAEFKLAEITYYRKDFEKAKEEYNKIVENYPNGNYVNDSLTRLFFINENIGLEEALIKFVEAELLEKQAKYNEALEIYRNIIADYLSSSLKDDSYKAIAEIYSYEQDYNETISAYNTFLEQCPNSDYIPEVYFAMAEIYEISLKQPQKAIEMYEIIVLEYSNSVIVETARKRLRELKNRVNS